MANFMDRLTKEPLSLCSVFTKYEPKPSSATEYTGVQHRISTEEHRLACNKDKLGFLERIILTRFGTTLPNYVIRMLRYCCSIDLGILYLESKSRNSSQEIPTGSISLPNENCVRLLGYFLLCQEEGIQNIVKEQLSKDERIPSSEREQRLLFFEKKYLPFTKRVFKSFFEQPFSLYNIKDLVDFATSALVYVWESQSEGYINRCEAHWKQCEAEEERRVSRSKAIKKAEKREQQSKKSQTLRIKDQLLFSGVPYELIPDLVSEQ
jgi:hypothetical protein